ncbi:MAG: AAA family ATPase [Desulfobacteraceae bacterium]|nr:AAA family ATPase [Desulfobacteraceae bacterium]
MLSFLRFLSEKDATVVFTSEGSAEAPDEDLQFLADGIIHMKFTGRDRRINVIKFRGADFVQDVHTLRISDKGLSVYPNLDPEAHKRKFEYECLSSGVSEIDTLMNGGLERGTITIITGPTGSGKSTLGMQFMKSAAGRGERSVALCVEENSETMLKRCEAVNIPVRQMMEQKNLSVLDIEPLKYAPGEFAHMIRREVEEEDARIVMLDSIEGYSMSLRGESLHFHIHSLSKYLANMGVTVLLVDEVENVTGDFRATEVGISYIADNVVFLRYLEIRGEIKKAIGVLKKRLSDFENTLRELEITPYGIKVGNPLTNLHGILSGTPWWRNYSDKE